MEDTRLGVFIVEDHQLFRDGLKLLLNSAPDIEVIGEAEDGPSAIQRVTELKPKLVLVDLSLPSMSGIEVISEIKRLFPTMGTLALTVHSNKQYVRAALKAGVDGYVLKDADRTEVLNAVKVIANGGRYLSPGISDIVISGFIDEGEAPSQRSCNVVLTSREHEILTLIAEGNTNRAIAERLSLSTRTVEKYRAKIMVKLDLNSPQALTAYAIKNGLINC
jgi:DNA-binding NarL/FixJ family response regulator